jgi:hypothetical protein
MDNSKDEYKLYGWIASDEKNQFIVQTGTEICKDAKKSITHLVLEELLIKIICGLVPAVEYTVFIYDIKDISEVDYWGEAARSGMGIDHLFSFTLDLTEEKVTDLMESRREWIERLQNEKKEEED